MAGPIRGKVDCFHNSGSQFTNAQAHFKNIYDFCVAHPNMSLIARHGGLTGGAANVNYYDETNPFLSNAWFVFRMNDATLESGAANPYAYGGARAFPWYLYVQWSRNDTTTWTSAPASPSAINASTTNLIAVEGQMTNCVVTGEKEKGQACIVAYCHDHHPERRHLHLCN